MFSHLSVSHSVHGWGEVHGRGTGSELLATSQLTIYPLPPKVGKFKWNYIFSGGKFPISTAFCNSLSVPNVSQTCKLVNNTLIGPEGPYKLIFKN